MNWPAITYVAGYCAHSALKKLACDACEKILVLTHRDMEVDDFSMISNLTKRGLDFPPPCVGNAVIHTELVVEILLLAECTTKFHGIRNQRKLALASTKSFLDNFEELKVCFNGHPPEVLL